MKLPTKMALVYVALLSFLPSFALAQSYNCVLQSYGAITGYKSKETGKTWLPPSLEVETGSNSVNLQYYGEDFFDASPQVDGEVWTAKDDLSVRPGRGLTVLLKMTFKLDRASGQATLNLTSKKTRYKPGSARAYYKCT